MFEEVKELRSLAVELMKANLILEDAKEGVRILKRFEKLGVSPDKHALLIKVCTGVEEPEFIDAAIRLVRAEDEEGISYEKAMSRFEKAIKRLPVVERKLQKGKSELEALDNIVSSRGQEAGILRARISQLKNEMEASKNTLEREVYALESRKTKQEQEFEARFKELRAETRIRKTELDREHEARLARMHKKAKAEQARLDQEFQTKMKQLGIKQEELEEVAKLKAGLKKQGMDMSILVELAKEFTHGKAES
ncbi:hypothetical protein ACFLV5_00935 [Chloroflexota bacterium]